MNKRQLSPAQLAYAQAKALHTVCYKAARDYDKLIDIEAEKLGIETPYAILPEGHPMMARAQELLDRENEAKVLLYAAAHNLFDWAVEGTLAKHGTPAQQASIRDCVTKVKAMAYVEKHFEDLVDISMRLAA